MARTCDVSSLGQDVRNSARPLRLTENFAPDRTPGRYGAQGKRLQVQLGPAILSVPAAAVGKVPHIDDLFAGEAVLVDQVLRQPAIHLPPPALAAARAFLVGLGHRVVVGLLLVAAEFKVVI